MRSAALLRYEEHATRAGLDPLQMLQRAGISRSYLDEPDLFLPYEQLVELLEDSAQMSGNPLFGAELGLLQGLDVLGPIAYLIRSSDTVARPCCTRSVPPGAAAATPPPAAWWARRYSLSRGSRMKPALSAGKSAAGAAGAAALLTAVKPGPGAPAITAAGTGAPGVPSRSTTSTPATATKPAAAAAGSSQGWRARSRGTEVMGASTTGSAASFARRPARKAASRPGSRASSSERSTSPIRW